MTKLKTLKELEKGIHMGTLKKVLDEKRELGSNWTTSILLAKDVSTIMYTLKWTYYKKVTTTMY